MTRLPHNNRKDGAVATGEEIDLKMKKECATLEPEASSIDEYSGLSAPFQKIKIHLVKQRSVVPESEKGSFKWKVGNLRRMCDVSVYQVA